MSKVDDRFEKMQDTINVLQNQLDVIKQFTMEEEGAYEIFPATTLYHQTTLDKKYIDFGALKFPVVKYFIEEIRPRSRKLRLRLNPDLEKDILKLATTTFGAEDYVVLISNENNYHSNTLTRLIFKSIAREKVGKITLNSRENEQDSEYEMQEIDTLSPTKTEATVKRSYLNVMNYNGYALENQNVILLNDEFGGMDAFTTLLIALKPRKLLNILFTGRSSWFDNVD